ncbi:MAG TPA: SRPBCC domain-containing protein [Solirubrobacteraceae bacterium]|nr:SRPBCC domain-containing protein [Solirubrobacteraceae bacterium]
MTDGTVSTDTGESWITIERTYDASAEQVWELWTTRQGIESWWGPDGFTVEVRTLELRPGGELRHAMTATAVPQVEFMKNAGMPLTTESRKTYTEVVTGERLAYTSLADFIPGVAAYEFATVVELLPDPEGVRVVMRVEPMHDEQWTQRLIAGRENELDNLARVLAGA